MTEADRAAFAELLLRLDTVYEKKPSKIRAEEYWRAFLPVPIGALRDAVSIHMQASDRFPRISTLHAIVARVQTQHATRALPPPTIEIDGDRAYSWERDRERHRSAAWQSAHRDAVLLPARPGAPRGPPCPFALSALSSPGIRDRRVAPARSW
jgi:hypothetical protein